MTTKKKKPKRLPNKLSALLRLAVKDAQAVAKLKSYRLNMQQWHNPAGTSGKCEVCMAGAVMVKELHAPRDKAITPDDYETSVYLKLDAIDDMRIGHFGVALQSVRSDEPSYDEIERAQKAGARIRLSYQRDPVRFSRAPWRSYLKAADELERMGL